MNEIDYQPHFVGGGGGSLEEERQTTMERMERIEKKLDRITQLIERTPQAFGAMRFEEDIYYMRCALYGHYARKYFKSEKVVRQICEMVGALLREEVPHGGGGVGMIRGWEEEIEEIESKRRGKQT